MPSPAESSESRAPKSNARQARSWLSPVIDIVDAAQESKVEGLRRVAAILSLKPISAIGRILCGYCTKRFDALLGEVGSILRSAKVEHHISDWPFEHFWGNPYEPRHSKFLHYLLDHSAEHRCGPYLLAEFFDTLVELKCFPDHKFPIEGYRVYLEAGNMDLRIEGNCDGKRYAVIIENKVNDAPNQDKQLQRYVDSVLNDGVSRKRIYVLYLPLTEEKEPAAADLHAIRVRRVHYAKISFSNHIVKWLDRILTTPSAESPKEMHSGLLDNVRHYRNLVKYLVNKQKQLNMNKQILKQLMAAEVAGTLPNWSDVDSLRASAAHLQERLESSLKGALLLRIQALLAKRNIESDFRSEKEPTEPILITSRFDEAFEDAINLCISVNSAVLVCVGGYSELEESNPLFWTGYVQIGKKSEQNQHKQAVMADAKKRYKEEIDECPGYYAWAFDKKVSYVNCLEEATAKRLATTIVEMRDNLQASFRTSRGAAKLNRRK